MSKIKLIEDSVERMKKSMMDLVGEEIMSEIREMTKDLTEELESIGWCQCQDCCVDEEGLGNGLVFTEPLDDMLFNGRRRDDLEYGNEESISLLVKLFKVSQESWRKGSDIICDVHTPVPALTEVSDFLQAADRVLVSAYGQHCNVSYFRPHSDRGERIEVSYCS